MSSSIIVSPESDTLVYVNQLGQNLIEISPSLPMQELLMPNTAHGFAYTQTLAALGMAPHLGKREGTMLNVLNVHSHGLSAEKQKQNLKHNVQKIAHESVNKRGGNERNASYLSRMLLHYADFEISADLPLDETVKRITYTIGDMAVDAGLRVIVGEQAPWHQKEVRALLAS